MNHQSTNCLDNAKVWLQERVRNFTTLTDFEIRGQKEISDHAYVFDVSYNWQLNSWTKHVDRRIVVVWSETKNDFVSSDL